MIVRVNGETRTFNQEFLTVSNVLTFCDVASPELVSVQINGTFLPQDKFDTTHLEENDELDFLYFMGGGR